MSAHSLTVLRMSPAVPRPSRAAPLPPEERRRAILDAVQPVILERGLDVTTRQLADAAGVAEGTLFRVFDDKEQLVREAAFAAADPTLGLDALAAIDAGMPLRDRLVRLVELMEQRVGQVHVWMTVLHRLGRGPDGQLHGHGARWAERQREGLEAVHAQMRRLLEPDADRLRLPLDDAVQAVDALVLGMLLHAGRVGMLHGGNLERSFEPRVIVDLLLDGMLAPTDPTPPTPPTPTGDAPTLTEGS